MFGRRFDIGLRLALSAMVVIMTGAPPGVCHCHAGGDKPHRHDLLVEHDNGHAHDSADHRPTAHHEHHGGANHAAVQCHMDNLLPPVVHWHYSWLGLNNSIPVSVGSPDAGRAQTESTFAVVRLLGDELPHFRPSPSPAVFLALGCGLSLPLVPMAGAITRCAEIPAAAAPLCDSARHERSGVQLI